MFVAIYASMHLDILVWIIYVIYENVYFCFLGFGLLESGTVSTKNEVNIMVKNAADVICGGFTYWMFGYAFSFGSGPGSNPFCGIGHFFVNADEKNIGWVFSKFFFQASFATTATTIVSGMFTVRLSCRSTIKHF